MAARHTWFVGDVCSDVVGAPNEAGEGDGDAGGGYAVGTLYDGWKIEGRMDSDKRWE